MRFTFFLSCLFFTVFLHAQDMTDPVKWSHEVTKTDGEVVITATAAIQPGWYVYSQFTPDGGPVPTRFDYGEELNLIGKTDELSHALKAMDELFDLEVIKFKEEAVFQQKIEKTQDLPTSSVVNVTYMSCNNQACLPPRTIQLNVNF